MKGEIAVIAREQVAGADYNLSPSRWVGQTEAVTQRPITEIIAEMQRLDEETREVDARLALLHKLMTGESF